MNYIKIKDALRAKIAAQTAEYLAKGNKITIVKHGGSGLGDRELSFIQRRLRGVGVEWGDDANNNN